MKVRGRCEAAAPPSTYKPRITRCAKKAVAIYPAGRLCAHHGLVYQAKGFVHRFHKDPRNFSIK